MTSTFSLVWQAYKVATKIACAETLVSDPTTVGLDLRGRHLHRLFCRSDIHLTSSKDVLSSLLMSSSSNHSTLEGTEAGQMARSVVQGRALRSTISSHQETSSALVMVPQGEKGPERQRDLLRLRDDYIHGRIAHDELHAMLGRLTAAEDAAHQRYLDFEARDRVGQAKPTAFFVGVYGYTEEEAEECIEEGARALDMRLANEARSRTRVLRNSTSGRGH